MLSTQHAEQTLQPPGGREGGREGGRDEVERSKVKTGEIRRAKVLTRMYSSVCVIFESITFCQEPSEGEDELGPHSP